jgi:hypothetical protein
VFEFGQSLEKLGAFIGATFEAHLFQIELYFSGLGCIMGCMLPKKPKNESFKATLAWVMKEMAEPRMSRSVREEGAHQSATRALPKRLKARL